MIYYSNLYNYQQKKTPEFHLEFFKLILKEGVTSFSTQHQ